MPEIIFSSINEVPEGLKEVAVQDGDKVKVNVVPKAKLDEFRENNVNLAKERDTLSGQMLIAKKLLGTEDFTEAEKTLGELRGTAQRVKDGELVENKGLEEAVAERTTKMREQFETQIREAAKEGASWRDKFTSTAAQLRRTYIDRAVTDVVLDSVSGVEPKALHDILARAYGVFQVGEDGKLTPKKGDTVLYGPDGSTVMTPKDWVATLKQDAPYFFKGNVGGGAGGGGEKPVHGGYTATELSKMTAQQKIAVANGELVKKTG